MCFSAFGYMPLLTERGYIRNLGAINILLLRSRNLDYLEPYLGVQFDKHHALLYRCFI